MAIFKCPNTGVEITVSDDDVKRFENPHEYYVDLSQKLWDIKYRLLAEHK